MLGVRLPIEDVDRDLHEIGADTLNCYCLNSLMPAIARTRVITVAIVLTSLHAMITIIDATLFSVYCEAPLASGGKELSRQRFFNQVYLLFVLCRPRSQRLGHRAFAELERRGCPRVYCAHLSKNRWEVRRPHGRYWRLNSMEHGVVCDSHDASRRPERPLPRVGASRRNRVCHRGNWLHHYHRSHDGH